MLRNAVRKIRIWIAKRRNKEPAVIIGDNEIHVKYMNPGYTGKYVWDSDNYAHGNLFLKDRANSIKLSDKSVRTDSVQLIPSYKVVQFMQQSAISQAFSTEDMTDLQKIAWIAIGGLVVINIVMSMMVLNGVS